MPIHRIAALVSSFNRRDLTLASLASLFRQKGLESLDLTVFLVDDGCTDGTGDSVRSQFPQVRVVQGNGSLFWNGGMRLAFDAAMKVGFDAYIFLNDDTFLYDDALRRMIECAGSSLASGKPAVVAGSTLSPHTGAQSYGGFVIRKQGLVMRLEQVTPHPSGTLPCDTMNGNFVLIPDQIARVLGNLEERFRHQFGDIDYGLRAGRAGFDVVVAPGYIGECAGNASDAAWRNPEISLAKRWKSLMSPKGVPIREWLLFTRRHFGWRWLHYSASPYVKAIQSSLLQVVSKRSSSDAPLPKH